MDKGYDADAIRNNLADRDIEAIIPGRSNRRVTIEHDRILYRQRKYLTRQLIWKDRPSSGDFTGPVLETGW